ncbi:S-adenosyl-L-homocysteine hydrolase [Novosphingobium sp. G106]|uniref:S-adenosyl-L-homocysteine hydrolase n=1 Tax=Novosphingobium sp. G106 TaxID=2849500 RepID=UPI001C2D2B36|nr:S-adenosyl-L-homocysteine hydrolase [Novosphingobium sp. G106]MBV1687050.1 S-adenosyl-L-homocysteine hydrolase [Novosphingobium sp. G106]
MERIKTAAPAAERGLLCVSLVAIAALAAGLALSNPAHAAGSVMGAEKLRRLDIMLMVTGLRCRTTADNFTADYGRFSSSQLRELNQANDELKADMARRYGAAGAQRALDRLSTTMANTYGQGHPWLSCAQLKTVAQNLSTVRGRATLEEAADQLLSSYSPQQFALATRR